MSDSIRARQLPKLKTTEKAALGRSDFRRIVRLLNRFLFGQHRLFILALVMLIAEAVTAVLEAYPLAYLIDYLKGDRPDLPAALRLLPIVSPLIDTIAALTMAIILMAMINSLADSLAEIFMARVGQRLGYNLRVSLYSHLQRLSLAFHDQRRTGDVLIRVTGDVAALEDFVIRSLSDIIGSLFVLAGTLVFLLSNTWQVALVAALIIPVLALVSNYFSQRIKLAAKKQRAREGELASAAQEMLTSIRVIQTYSRAGHEQKRFAEYSQKSMDAALEAAGLQARFSWVVKVMESLTISAVVWIGLLLINRNAITVGMLLMFVILIQNMFKPTRKIIKEWNTIGKIYASVERIGELLDRKPTVQDEPGAIEAPPLQGHVDFRSVTFAYQLDPEDAAKLVTAPAQARLALNKVSFAIAPGKVLALVGHTGAGKSTIAQLLPRLYDPHAGQILIDGHNIREFTLDSLRSQISMVLQETILFSGSVADNIAYGRTDATREEIVAAAIQANAHEFIEKMPEGYDTLLGERGANLSGGQRQRIAIARAFIRNTPILILDEPATGLDAASTDLVLVALRTLMKGKTTIIISHDFNLIRHADKIVVIKEGKIEQVGTHKSLLEAGGLYASLYFKQFGLAEAEQGAGAPRPNAAPTDEPVSTARTSLEVSLAEAPPMLAISRRSRLDPAQLDLLSNPSLQRQLPGLTTAFDARAMREHLQAALFDKAHDRYTIEHCAPGKASYLAEEGCILRYELEVKDSLSGQVLKPLVNARVFPSQSASETYLCDRLSPLATLMHGRDEIAPFGTPVALLRSLNMVVSVFPIDGELPTIVGATDRQRMIEVFHETLPEALAEGLAIEDCRPELGHYGRQHRCVLRYQIEGRLPGADKTQRRTVYGKVAADGRGALTSLAVATLRERVLDNGSAYRFNVPRSLGFRPDLQLALLEAIPGAPRINQLLAARLNGAGDSTSGALTLEEALDACARIAATLHTSGITQGRRRMLDDELAELRRQIYIVWRLSPMLAEQLQAWLERIEAYAEPSDPLKLCFSHGDFTYTQLIFDNMVCGLVDFDTVCQAEPMLDLGQFLAYLRVAALKTQRAAPGADAALTEQLCAQFLDTYIAASGSKLVDEKRLRFRASVYEVVSLLRMALRSWQKLKGSRLEHVIAVLEEQVSCLPGLS